jgi:hypothetical protein
MAGADLFREKSTAGWWLISQADHPQHCDHDVCDWFSLLPPNFQKRRRTYEKLNMETCTTDAVSHTAELINHQRAKRSREQPSTQRARPALFETIGSVLARVVDRCLAVSGSRGKFYERRHRVETERSDRRPRG